MPGKQHVFLALFAGVTDQLECQSVIASPGKLVLARTPAAFRTFSTRFLDCNSITGDCIIAYNVTDRVNDIDIERPVGLPQEQPDIARSESNSFVARAPQAPTQGPAGPSSLRPRRGFKRVTAHNL